MLTKKDLQAISKLLDEKFAKFHKEMRVIHEDLREILKTMVTKQDIREIGDDIGELRKFLRMYMELTKTYREKQTILEERVDAILANLGYSEN